MFTEEPALEKRTGAPAGFKWRGREHRVKRVVKEWHEYDRSRLAPGRPPVGSHSPLGRGSGA
ncbi:MAG: DUF6504 family protein [Firmicutes bacterium]|nr:DUF6504 family protein [Bacillota bacterium]